MLVDFLLLNLIGLQGYFNCLLVSFEIGLDIELVGLFRFVVGWQVRYGGDKVCVKYPNIVRT